jgi:LAO/AO transport system kinase
MKKRSHFSALSVGKESLTPSSVNPYLTENNRIHKKLLSEDILAEGILAKDTGILSQAITLIESTHPDHLTSARKLVERLLPFSGNAFRVGITGVPGVGKSTFIDTLGIHFINQGHRVAVLAIDPSSERTKGSILGDKTRMSQLAASPDAFIRPSPSGLTLGGVTQTTTETIILCEAAGFDIIFVETVGVGQSETTVKNMVDFFLLLMLSGAGDELQGIKRGIMEMADALIINKADGDNIGKAIAAQVRYKTALHLFSATESGWTVPVLTCSSLENTGISDTMTMLLNYKQHSQNNGFFYKNRKDQFVKTFLDGIQQTLLEKIYEKSNLKIEIEQLSTRVREREVSPYEAIQLLMAQIF